MAKRPGLAASAVKLPDHAVDSDILVDAVSQSEANVGGLGSWVVRKDYRGQSDWPAHCYVATAVPECPALASFLDGDTPPL